MRYFYGDAYDFEQLSDRTKQKALYHYVYFKHPQLLEDFIQSIKIIESYFSESTGIVIGHTPSNTYGLALGEMHSCDRSILISFVEEMKRQAKEHPTLNRLNFFVNEVERLRDLQDNKLLTSSVIYEALEEMMYAVCEEHEVLMDKYAEEAENCNYRFDGTVINFK